MPNTRTIIKKTFGQMLWGAFTLCLLAVIFSIGGDYFKLKFTDDVVDGFLNGFHLKTQNEWVNDGIFIGFMTFFGALLNPIRKNTWPPFKRFLMILLASLIPAWIYKKKHNPCYSLMKPYSKIINNGLNKI